VNKYELIVLGIAPAGEQAALKAASLGCKVAIVEALQSEKPPPPPLHPGFHKEPTAALFRYQKNYLFEENACEIKENLKRNGVDLYQGLASFEDPHTLVISGPRPQRLQGSYILIATGSSPYHPPEIPFDGKRIHDADSILTLKKAPKSLCIAGAGVIGCEYTSLFSSLGTLVYLVNDAEKVLPQIDRELSSELLYQMKRAGVHLFLGTRVERIENPEEASRPLKIRLGTDVEIEAECFLFAAGRLGNTRTLKGERIGLKIQERDTIGVDAAYRSNIAHIYAVGDVIGFASLAGTNRDQGAAAVSHIFRKNRAPHLPKAFPYALFTAPEIALVGLSEEEAQKENIDYSTGIARYDEATRSKLMEEARGFLKIVFNRSTLGVLGIHIIGPLASELIHYGVALLENQKKLDHVAEDLFTYPSLHHLYKLAALDGIKNGLRR